MEGRSGRCRGVSRRLRVSPGGLPICPVIVKERAAFAEAFAAGRGVTEHEPAGAAAGEIRKLLMWGKERLR